MPDRVQRATDYASKLRREQEIPFMRSVFKAAERFKIDWEDIQKETSRRSAIARHRGGTLIHHPMLGPEEPEPELPPKQQELEFGEPGEVKDYVLKALQQ